MKFTKTLFICTAAMLYIASDAMAQSIRISPPPQEIQWSEEKAFDNNVSYTITGEADADTDAINLVKGKLAIEEGGIQIIIGERGDASVADYESLIPQKAEGYYLSVESDKVIIAGNDEAGTFYGVQSYLQIAEQPEVMKVTISDYPDVPQRGLVEGYYGNPYSEENRMSLFEMFGRQKMNVYIYGPKDDKYHKEKWRENYPTAQGKKITEYVNAAKANKVEFVWAIHPGDDIQWNDTDRRNIVNKLKAMYNLGVRTFAVFFDDVWGGEGTRGDKQAELMNYITEQLAASYDDVNPCIICPTQYNKGWSSGDYLNTLGSTMNKEVRIMWTGNSVVDMINKSDMTWINNQISRKAFIWLNYPVTDYCINHLLMGPTWGNDLDIANMLSGFTSNPMEYAEASKLSLFSIGEYNWNMTEYDADESWVEAIKYLMPKNSEAFRFFCENNVDLGVNTHGLRRTDESPEFEKAMETYNAKMAAGNRSEAYAAVGAQFEKLIQSADIMLGSDEARALVEEITPWIMSMKYLGERGNSLIAMNNAIVQENAEDFVENYLKYKEYTEAQTAIRARDFSGSLKVASPVVGTVHIEPFVKEKLGELVALYKESYDYRLDLFPAQTLENGTYYIMYEGRYLTNKNPRVASSAPQFVSGKDTIRPQRQEWKITLDGSTGRYKIINLEDNRYLNEKGTFTASDETNPYEAAWHTYVITQLANGKFAIQNAGSAGNNFWSVSNARINKSSSSEALPDKYIFDIVPLGGEKGKQTIESGEIYYIMDGSKYLGNNNANGSGGTPTFKTVKKPSKLYEWQITIDKSGKNCYKITSNADGRYLNENGVFGTNQYYSDWNTYLITRMGDKYSLQQTQSAISNGVKYLVVSGDRLEAKSVSLEESYTVTIISKADATSIESTEDANIKVWYDTSAQCIICSGVDDGSIITVSSTSGTTVDTTTAYGNIASVPMRNNPSAVYIVTINGNEGVSTYKILKQ